MQTVHKYEISQRKELRRRWSRLKRMGVAALRNDPGQVNPVPAHVVDNIGKGRDGRDHSKFATCARGDGAAAARRAEGEDQDQSRGSVWVHGSLHGVANIFWPSWARGLADELDRSSRWLVLKGDNLKKPTFSCSTPLQSTKTLDFLPKLFLIFSALPDAAWMPSPLRLPLEVHERV